MNKKKNTSKSKRKLNEDLLTIVIGLAIATVIGLFTMGWFFTLALVIGIILIILFSMLVNKLKRKKPLRIIINILAVFILLVCIAGLGAVGWFFKYVVDNAPEFETSVLYKSQSSIVYDNKSQEFAELGTEKREIITYEEMSESLIDSIISVEDSRFFQHNGFDAARFFVASIKQVVLGQEDAGGASTLTMQVAKNNYTSTNDEGFEGIVRKFTDIYLSVFKIEKEFSKQEILEFYANIHFLGNNAYGVEQAAQTYFGKAASELSLAETSIIAGMFKAPVYYDPFTNPQNLTQRRNTVLNLMVHHGYITQEEADIAKSIPVESLLVDRSDETQKYYSYLNTVVDEAMEKYGVNPYTTSVLIYTNMDAKKQQKLDNIFSGKTYDWVDPVVQAGVAAVDVDTGKIIAIAAGRGKNSSAAGTHNFATKSNRQIGSVAKPLFDYGPGIEYNNWSTYTLFNDEKYTYSSGQEIRNSDRTYMGLMTLREALAQSRNVPALKAFQQVDNKKIYEFVTKLGITLEADSIRSKYLHEAYSIGAFNGSNPLEMAAAYAAFANGGYYYEPYTISKIVFRDTDEVFTHESTRVKVMSDATAFMITDCLKTAVTDGLSGVAKVNGVNVAAKTGTTNFTPEIKEKYNLPDAAINDAWVVGYDPDTALALWYGYEPINSKYYTTVNTAYTQRKKLYNALGKAIFEKTGKDFEVPDSVVKVAIEVGTDENQPAKLPSENTPENKIVYEYFKVGTEPTEVSDAYNPLSNVSNLKVVYDSSTLSVNIQWSAAKEPVDNVSEKYGSFGYRVYKDNVYLGFTTNTAFNIPGDANPSGTYKVVTSFEKYTKRNSSGSIYILTIADPATYKVNFTVSPTMVYYVGDPLNAFDLNPSKADVSVFKDSTEVTGDATVKVSISDKNNSNIDNITSVEENIYTITYDIVYGTYTDRVTRTVSIIKKEEPITP